MMLAMQQKPSIDDLVAYLKSKIPNCQITDAEINDLRSLYDSVSYKNINRVFHQAIHVMSMQPVSYICRQLRIIRPEAEPHYGKEDIEWYEELVKEVTG